MHRPKPFHDWREFAGEVLIIVLGVGIALGAEQLIEANHWRNQLAEAKAAIVTELRDDDLPKAMTRIALAPCLARDLDQLQAAVEDGRDRGKVVELIGRYQPPTKTWDNQAWQTALASGAAAHSGPRALVDFGGAYVELPHLQLGTSNNGDFVLRWAA